jgi:hypothetical protein
MPYDDPDPTDPQMLVGVALPSDDAATRDMAYVLAEEFARMGFDTQGLLSLFRDPFYAGAHGVYRTLGEESIRTIVEECVTVWGRTVGKIQDAPGVFRDDLLRIETDGPLMTNGQ